MKKAKKRRPPVQRTYTVIDELMASATSPLPTDHQRHQLTRMWGGLRALERMPEPTTDDWRVCSDAVNLMDTLINENGGWWPGCDGDLVQVLDTNGLLQDAITGLGKAGQRNKAGGPIRLDAAGILAVRAILEDYAAALAALPARSMVRAHRLTEDRIYEIRRQRSNNGDVRIISV